MLLIACSLSLLAIAAGLFLLAMSKKENLGSFYKIVSWFIIACGFLCMVCIGTRCMMHSYCGPERCKDGRPCFRSESRESCHGEMMEQDGMMEHKCHEGMKKGCCKMMEQGHEADSTKK